jgi:hypothetical protein
MDTQFRSMLPRSVRYNPRLGKVIIALDMKALLAGTSASTGKGAQISIGAAGSTLFEPIFFGVAENVRLPNLSSHAAKDFPVLSDNPRRGS